MLNKNDVTNSFTQKLYKYSTQGGYPLFYATKNCDCLCAECADKRLNDPDEIIENKPCDCEPNWENPDLFCDECGERIESAYADEDESEGN